MFLAKILENVIDKIFFEHVHTDWNLERKNETKMWFAQLIDELIMFVCVMIKHAIYEKNNKSKII